jgi:mono/diheme cytochrome c family protein
MRTIALVIAASLIGACAQTPPAPPPASKGAVEAAPATTEAKAELVGQGRRLAEMLCVTCHAIGGSGESPEPMAPAFRRLAQRYPLNALEEAFAEGILVGHPMMPSYKLSEAQIEALLAYLASIQERATG